MASEKYSADFKLEVARGALSRDRKGLETLSEKYSVPVSLILTWALQLEKKGPESFEDDEGYGQKKSGEQFEAFEVDISDADVAESIEVGAMSDRLNYKRLVFWSVLGLVLVMIFGQGLFEMYKSNRQLMRERVSSQSEYHQSTQLRSEAERHLSGYGVADPEAGTFHVPIDSVINEMAEGSQP